MQDRMETVLKRKTYRNYIAEAIAPETKEKVEALVKATNEESGLDFRVVWNDFEPFLVVSDAFGPDAGKNIRHYVILTGEGDDVAERCGFYGERLALALTDLGLGTWFNGGTYDGEPCRDLVKNIDDIIALLAFGPVEFPMPEKEKALHDAIVAKLGRHCVHVADDGETPDWYQKGVQAVEAMPRAISGARIDLSFVDGTAHMKTGDDKRMTRTNLGIAKANFDYVAQCGTWNWGPDATYTLQ